MPTASSWLRDTDALAYEASRASFTNFLNIVRINSLPAPRPFSQLSEPWQWNDFFTPITPSVHWLAFSERERGDLKEPHLRGIWNTKSRGSFKTGAIALVLLYLLVFARREVPLKMSVAAADSDQAALVKDAMQTIANINPWLGRHVSDPHGAITKKMAVGPGGEVTILASDAGSAYGLGDDLTVCDELTHWARKDLYVAMTSGRFKRQHNLMNILTNAGYIGTWQHDVLIDKKGDPRLGVAPDPNWFVNDEQGFKPNWVNKEAVQEAWRDVVKTTGSTQEADRLIYNVWCEGTTGSCFSAESIMSMGRPTSIEPFPIPEAA